jgi:hypothetical protein
MNSISDSKCSNGNAMSEAVKLAEEMLKIAERGFYGCEDDGCLVVYGIIRDCGYKIRKAVEQEQHGVLPDKAGRSLMH